jgi:hypothetical protein
LFLSLQTKSQVVFALLIIRKFGKNVVWFWQPAGTLGLYRMEQIPSNNCGPHPRIDYLPAAAASGFQFGCGFAFDGSLPIA